MVRLLRMRHSEHAAPHQWLQVMAPEEGPVCQSEFAHQVGHGARYVAEHYDLPLILIQVLKPLRLVTDQLTRYSVSLVSDQVLPFVVNLVSQSGVFGQVLGQGVCFAGFDGSEEHFCDQCIGKRYGVRSCQTRYGLDLRKRDRLFPAAGSKYSCLFIW